MRLRGLTLVEILVTISALALLTAILLPALGISREHAKATLCSSRVRQLLLGLSSYEAQNEKGHNGEFELASKRHRAVPGLLLFSR